jgi:hypothetical protein
LRPADGELAVIASAKITHSYSTPRAEVEIQSTKFEAAKHFLQIQKMDAKTISFGRFSKYRWIAFIEKGRIVLIADTVIVRHSSLGPAAALIQSRDETRAVSDFLALFVKTETIHDGSLDVR